MAGFFGKIDDFIAALGIRFWLWFSVISFLFIYGLINHLNLAAWPSLDVFLRTVDSDVYIRMTKVRELIQGGSLHDHIVAATNAPYGGISTPWTRPLDFILVALYQFSPADLSIEKRLLLVANWYPLLIVALILFTITKAAETGFKSVQKFVLVILCFIPDILFNVHNYFMVGNVDHHSLQALLWCVTIWALLSPSSRPSTLIILGTTLGLWFWISPEALPFIFMAYAVLGIKAILKPEQSYVPTLTSIVIALVTFLALFIEYPTDKILSSLVYDANSIIYVILFSFSAIGFLALHYVIAHQPTLKIRIIASAIVATILSVIYISLFPKFLSGPMADVDPYIITNFLPRISEASPIWKLDAADILASQYLAIPAILLSLRFIKHYPALFAILIVPFVMNAFQTRWSAYLEIASIITIAKLLPTYARLLGRNYNKIALHPYALMVYLSALAYGISAILPPAKSQSYGYIYACQFEAFQTVQSGRLVVALGDQPLTIESNALGNSGIPFFTPYHYVAGYYHREGVGLKIKNAILDTKDLESVRPLLKERHVQALLICPTSYPSWANDYFSDTIPQHDWVQVNDKLKFRDNPSKDIPHPVLLNIEP